MQRYDFYFGQKVRHTELDNAFDAVENAIAAFLQGFGYSGIVNGADVAEHNPTPNFTVDVSGPALVYDQLSQKIAWSATENIDCTVDENGAATAVTTSGNEKYLSIFAEYERLLSDPRTDRNGATVFFNRAESYKINVVQGVEAPTGTAVKPALRADQVLLGDVLITYGMTQIQNSDIDLDRAEYPYDFTGSPLAIREKGLGDVLQTMVDEINAFTASAALLAGNNVFTGTNEFQGNVTLTSPASLVVGNDLTVNDRTYLNGVSFVDAEIYFNETTTPQLVNARMLIDYDFPTSGPTRKAQVFQLSDNASGNPNARMYSFNGGVEFVIGAEWSGTTWYYESGVSEAYRLRIEHETIALDFHDGSDGWANGSWSDTYLIHEPADGLTIFHDSSKTTEPAVKFVNDKTVNTVIALMLGYPSASGWDFQGGGTRWQTATNLAELHFPIRLPKGMGAAGANVNFDVEVIVEPGDSRSSGNRMEVALERLAYDFTTPSGPSVTTVDSAEDNGGASAQKITVSGTGGYEIDGEYEWRVTIKASSDAVSNTDYMRGIKLSYSDLDRQPFDYSDL